MSISGTHPPLKFVQLSPDLLQHVCTFLRPKDLSNLAQTNRNTNQLVVQEYKRIKVIEIKSIIDYLIQHLDSDNYSYQMTQLQALTEDGSIQGSIGIKNIESFSSVLKEKVIEILKEIPEEELTRLEKDFPNPLLIKIAKLLSSLKGIELIENIRDKAAAFGRVAVSLAKLGRTDLALQIVNKIPTNFSTHDATLSQIAVILFNSGKGKEGIELAANIRNELSQTEALKTISNHFLDRGEADQARDIVLRMKNTDSKVSSLRNLYLHLSQGARQEYAAKIPIELLERILY